MGIRRNRAPVTESPVDPALFRLRAFEADWLTPLLDAPPSELNAVLAAEAQRWLSLGMDVGYFAEAPLVGPQFAGPLPEEVAGFFQGELPIIDIADFGLALTQAQDDLTLERREFLDLVFFADDAVWHSHLHEVWELAGALAGRPTLRLSAEAMDSVSWSLEGAASHIAGGTVYLPAHWRSSDQPFIQAMWPLAQERLASLNDARDAIAAAADSLAADDTASIKLPTATVPRTVSEGEAAAVALVTLTAVSLGLETFGGKMTTVVERNMALPASQTQIFSTVEDDQATVDVVVLQGESELAADNRELVRFHLEGIDPAPRGLPQIEVTFEIDVNGTIKVSARELKTGTEQKVTITEIADVEEREIEQMVHEADEHSD